MGYKNTSINTGPTNGLHCQLLLALCCRNKLTLGKNGVCRDTTCKSKLTEGDTPRDVRKMSMSTLTFISWWKMRLMVLLLLDRTEKCVELERWCRHSVGLHSLSFQLKRMVNRGTLTQGYVLEGNLYWQTGFCSYTNYLLTIWPQGNVSGAFDHIKWSSQFALL